MEKIVGKHSLVGSRLHSGGGRRGHLLRLHLGAPLHLGLVLRDLPDLVADVVQVVPPRGEQAVQVVPVLLGERSVHRGGDADHAVRLVDLGAHQLRLQH